MPCFYHESNDETVQDANLGKLNLYCIDAEHLSSYLGAESDKDAEILFHSSLVLATDYLVESELIISSPVQLGTIRFGIITVVGDHHFLKERSTRLNGITESGMWNAVVRNVSSKVQARLIHRLVSGIQEVKNTACRYNGLSHDAYQSYISALSSVKLTDKGQDFFYMVTNVAKTFIPILRETDALIETNFLKK